MLRLKAISWRVLISGFINHQILSNVSSEGYFSEGG